MCDPAPPPPPELRASQPSPMPNPSNSDLVGEAKRLSEAATPGPWDVVEINRGVGIFGPRSATYPVAIAHHAEREDNAEFIARARTLLPELAQQLEQAKQREKRYREALERYENEAPGWLKNIARAALTPDEGAEPPVESEEEG